MSAAAPLMPPAASRRFSRTQKHRMSRRERISLIWNRAVHRMLDAPTHGAFLMHRDRAFKLSQMIDQAAPHEFWWNRESA